MTTEEIMTTEKKKVIAKSLKNNLDTYIHTIDKGKSPLTENIENILYLWNMILTEGEIPWEDIQII